MLKRKLMTAKKKERTVMMKITGLSKKEKRLRIIRIIASLSALISALTLSITAFAANDADPPTVNAAINNGKLKVTAVDDSGIKAIYVNEYEFFDPKDGVLTIRLEKFDAGMEYFTIAAMDYAGNKTENYELKNPYWTDPEAEKNGSEKDPAEDLPADASPTGLTDAEGEVTDHVETDADGNIIEQDEMFYTGENDPTFGREFYTITARTGKVFYLIIDRTDQGEVVHFVTDISENDLLNVTDGNSQTLPKNSVAASSSVPISEVHIATEEGGEITVSPGGDRIVTDKDGNIIETSIPPEPEPEPVKKKFNPIFAYIGAGVLFFGIVFYFKIIRKKKKEKFVEDEKAAEAEEAEGDSEEILVGGDPLDKDGSDDEFFNDDEE